MLRKDYSEIQRMKEQLTALGLLLTDVTPESWTVTTLRSCGSAAPFSEPAERCFVVQRRVSPLLVEVA